MTPQHEVRLYRAVERARKLMAGEASIEGAVIRACSALGIDHDDDRATVLARVARAIAGCAAARDWMRNAKPELREDDRRRAKRQPYEMTE